MKNKLEQYIVSQGLFTRKDKLLLAISGGVDSVVLFHLLLALGYDVHCAHVNYHLRGDESNGDEAFVRELCGQHDVSLEVLQADMSEYKSGIQERARDIRYQWFARLKETLQYNYLLTAHHLDDSIETFFINLSRGTGLAGLTGIKSLRATARPLMNFTKAQVSEYATENKLPYRQDSSNSDDKYLRNAIKHKVIPPLKEVAPGFEITMAGNLENLASSQRFIENTIANLASDMIVKKDNVISISKTQLTALDQPQFVLFHFLQPYHFTWSQVGQILTAAQTGRRFLTDEYVLFVGRSDFQITQLTNESPTVFSINDKLDIEGDLNQLKLSYVNLGDETIQPFPQMAYLDVDQLDFPLTVRPWRDGDKFQPLGMQGKKLVSDFLTQEKIATSQRKQQLVLESNNRIAWVLGKRIAHPFRITDKTKRVLKMEYNG